MKWLEKISSTASGYFALWVALASAIGLIWPSTFLVLLPHIGIVLGVIMFGMGMTLSPADFKRVATRPAAVGAGVGAQFMVMPLLAFGIARLLHLSPELAVGFILLGTSPGGTASNVITYLARGDVALSVTMTSISTVLSPLLTPLLTLWLAGHWMPVPVSALFLSILQIVLVPVILGVTQGFRLRHHGNVDLAAVEQVECALPSPVLLEGVLPGRIEVDGVGED